MPFVYIAGPYRAKDGRHDATAYFEIDENIRIAEQVFIQLAEAGIPAFCPHLHSAHGEVKYPQITPDFWYELNLAILDHAAALFLLPRWRESTGAKEERRYAISKNIVVFGDEESPFDRLVEWWRSGIYAISKRV